eukprot:Opistho-2@2410
MGEVQPGSPSVVAVPRGHWHLRLPKTRFEWSVASAVMLIMVWSAVVHLKSTAGGDSQSAAAEAPALAGEHASADDDNTEYFASPTSLSQCPALVAARAEVGWSEDAHSWPKPFSIPCAKPPRAYSLTGWDSMGAAALNAQGPAGNDIQVDSTLPFNSIRGWPMWVWVPALTADGPPFRHAVAASDGHLIQTTVSLGDIFSAFFDQTNTGINSPGATRAANPVRVFEWAMREGVPFGVHCGGVYAVDERVATALFQCAHIPRPHADMLVTALNVYVALVKPDPAPSSSPTASPTPKPTQTRGTRD